MSEATESTIDTAGVTRPRRYRCQHCGLTGVRPMVVPIANPRHASSGRCSNRQACEARQRRTANRAKEQKS